MCNLSQNHIIGSTLIVMDLCGPSVRVRLAGPVWEQALPNLPPRGCRLPARTVWPKEAARGPDCWLLDPRESRGPWLIAVEPGLVKLLDCCTQFFLCFRSVFCSLPVRPNKGQCFGLCHMCQPQLAAPRCCLHVSAAPPSGLSAAGGWLAHDRGIINFPEWQTLDVW